MQLSRCMSAREMCFVARHALSLGPLSCFGLSLTASSLPCITATLLSAEAPAGIASKHIKFPIFICFGGHKSPPSLSPPPPMCMWILIHTDVRIDTWCSASLSVRNETCPCSQAWVPVNFSSVNSCLLVSSYSPQMVPISQISLYISMRYLEKGTCSNKLSSLLFTCLSTLVPWLTTRAGSVSAY